MKNSKAGGASVVFVRLPRAHWEELKKRGGRLGVSRMVRVAIEEFLGKPLDGTEQERGKLRGRDK